MRIFLFFFFTAVFSNSLYAQNINISNGAAFEGEPFIAMNPNNNQHLVVAWMGFKLGQEIIIKTRTTFDGGQSWSNTSEMSHLQAGYGSADPSLKIVNQGREVKSGKLSDKSEVSIDDLNQGQYFIYLSNGVSIATFKFVKN